MIDQWLAECEGATPGELDVEESDSGAWAVLATSTGRIIYKVNIGVYRSAGEYDPWPEGHANLRLLASARTRLPAALRALKAAVEALEVERSVHALDLAVSQELIATLGKPAERNAERLKRDITRIDEALAALAKELGGGE